VRCHFEWQFGSLAEGLDQVGYTLPREIGPPLGYEKPGELVRPGFIADTEIAFDRPQFLPGQWLLGCQAMLEAMDKDLSVSKC
jgi:hypothetical protein